ncbi:MAG: RecX family transcriptional regulator [Actinomycetota bacterium]
MSSKLSDSSGDSGAPRKRALRRALAMLTYRPRSREEICRDLSVKGFKPDVVDDVVAELSEKRLLCDPSLARDIVASGQRSGKSRAKIYSELRRRGIDREVAEESLEACFDASLEREAAVKAMDCLLTPHGHSPSCEDIEKAARKLAGRGFSSSAVAYALRDASARAGETDGSRFLDTVNKLP